MLKNPKSAKLETMLKHEKPRFIYKIIVTIIMMVIAIEGLSRLYLFQQFHHFFPNRNTIIKSYYPELQELDNIISDNNHYDYEILILGASVTNDSFGSIRKNLEKQLSDKTSQSVRVTNFSRPAHSSLDSFLKYSTIEHTIFDLIIIYHNINELRANHVPDNLFKSNYSHLDWYYEINKHLSTIDYLSPFATPYILSLLYLQFKHNDLSPLPHDKVRFEWLYHGQNIKTKKSFRKNISNIIKHANKYQAKVLILTYAYYIPKDYSNNKFISKTLDYSFKNAHSFPLSIWGDKTSLSLGLALHNTILKEQHETDPTLLFVDQYNKIPKKKKYFNDVCHLTEKGGELFVNNLLDIISLEIDKKEHSVSTKYKSQLTTQNELERTKQ